MQSFYNGLSGMLSFSKGIDVLSQNIANMNTPGYKGSNAIFSSFNSSQGGIGSSVTGTQLQTEQGDYQDNGSSTSLALDGNGYFVLQDEEGKMFYTRAGQFRFDENLDLVDSSGNYHVMAIDEAGNLSKITLADVNVFSPEATENITFSGQLLASEDSHDVEDVQIYDASGDTHNLSLNFINQNNNTWQVSIETSDGNTVGTHQVQFNLDGSPLDGSNTFIQTFEFNGAEQDITFTLGEPGSFSNSFQIASGTTNLGATVEDGSAISGYTSIEFDEFGVIKVNYANGENATGQQLALASFNDISALVHSQNGLYKATDDAATIGTADNGQVGKVLSGKLELSNVELTEQFAQLLIAQQGYSASSRVMNVANQLIDTLYSNTGGR